MACDDERCHKSRGIYFIPTFIVTDQRAKLDSSYNEEQLSNLTTRNTVVINNYLTEASSISDHYATRNN